MFQIFLTIDGVEYFAIGEVRNWKDARVNTSGTRESSTLFLPLIICDPIIMTKFKLISKFAWLLFERISINLLCLKVNVRINKYAEMIWSEIIIFIIQRCHPNRQSVVNIMLNVTINKASACILLILTWSMIHAAWFAVNSVPFRIKVHIVY